MINQRAEEEKLKRDMVCPYSRVPIKNMPALKAHVGSQRWRELCMASEGDVMDPQPSAAARSEG